jgi:5-methylcytosine-specific restriction endonuclease McrA
MGTEHQIADVKSAAAKAQLDKRKAQKAAWYKANREKMAAQQLADKERLIAYRKANADKIRARGAAWHLANKEKRNAQSAAWQKANPDRSREFAAAYRKANVEKVRAATAAYHKANPEKERARAAAYRKNNLEKEKARNAAYSKAHPDTVRAVNAARRARKAGAEGRYTAADIAALFKAQGGKCAGCKAMMSKDGKIKGTVRHTTDHVIALKNGGTNWPENLQLLCCSCNSSKAAMDDLEWANAHGKLFV